MVRCIDHPTMLKDGFGWGAMCSVSAAQMTKADFTGAPALTSETEQWKGLASDWFEPKWDDKASSKQTVSGKKIPKIMPCLCWINFTHRQLIMRYLSLIEQIPNTCLNFFLTPSKV
jgi:hypothetical protein